MTRSGVNRSGDVRPWSADAVTEPTSASELNAITMRDEMNVVMATSVLSCGRYSPDSFEARLLHLGADSRVQSVNRRPFLRIGHQGRVSGLNGGQLRTGTLRDGAPLQADDCRGTNGEPAARRRRWS